MSGTIRTDFNIMSKGAARAAAHGRVFGLHHNDTYRLQDKDSFPLAHFVSCQCNSNISIFFTVFSYMAHIKAMADTVCAQHMFNLIKKKIKVKEDPVIELNLVLPLNQHYM